jgi:hypothetical protein
MHVKRQIQHLLREAVAKHLPLQGAYLDRVAPLFPKNCPAATLRENEGGERIRDVSSEGLQQRDLLVDVALCVAMGEEAGEAVALLGLQAEKLIAADDPARAPEIQRLNALCPMGVVLRQSRTFISGEGEHLLAVQRQVWQCSYLVYPDAPDEAQA